MIFLLRLICNFFFKNKIFPLLLKTKYFCNHNNVKHCRTGAMDIDDTFICLDCNTIFLDSNYNKPGEFNLNSVKRNYKEFSLYINDLTTIKSKPIIIRKSVADLDLSEIVKLYKGED